jgi:hypothetical protein
LDEGINPYQSIGWTLRSGTGIVISQRAPLDLLWGNAMKKMTAPIPFAGSQLDQTRHVSAFFNSADEGYRVLLPWGCWEHLLSQQGQQDFQNCARTCCDLRHKSRRGGDLTSLVNSALGAPYASLAVRIHEF